MSEHVRLTIEELRRRRQQCDEAIRLLLELEGPATPPFVQMPSELVKPGPVPPCAAEQEIIPEKIPQKHKGLSVKSLGHKPRQSQAAGAGKGKPGPIPSKDKPERKKPGPKVSGRGKKPNHHSTKKLLRYKGVKPLKPKVDGALRFEGHTRVDGKFKYLGTFNVEELAAAAVMEAEGNKAEAKRLREIAKQKAADEAEQRDINPDKPTSRRAAQQAEKSDPLIETPDPVKPVAVTWECNKCGRPHVQIERPKVCFKCLKDFGFSRITKPQSAENER